MLRAPFVSHARRGLLLRPAEASTRELRANRVVGMADFEGPKDPTHHRLMGVPGEWQLLAVLRTEPKAEQGSSDAQGRQG